MGSQKHGFLDLFGATSTAVLVVDKQKCYMDTHTLESRGRTVDSYFSLRFKALEDFIEYSRQLNVPVVWTQMIEDIELSPVPIRQKIKLGYNKQLSDAPKFRPGSEEFGFAGDVLPLQTERVFVKNHYDAFADPELGEYLSSLGIKAVVIIGGFASRCVLATTVGANNHDLHVLVLKDLVLSPEKFEPELPSTLSIIDGILGYVCESSDLEENWRS